MQNKPDDRPKIIALTIGIIVVALLAVWRVSATMQANNAASRPPDATTAALTPSAPAGTGPVTSGSAGVPVASAVGVVNPGQMRRFDDTMDTDAPVGSSESSGGPADAFRAIVAPTVIAANPFAPRPVHNNALHPTPSPYGPVIEPTVPMMQMVAAPPLEVVLDGVYQSGSERVAQLTIVEKGDKSSDKSQNDQTVYRRVGEYIGRFKIARLTDNGLALTGLRRAWQVGETQKLDEGMIPALRPLSPAPASRTLPILSPR